MFDFFLFCILFSCCCCFLFLLLWYFVFFDFWLPIKNISQKIGNCKKNKNDKCRKKDTGTRAVSTSVLTNSVYFSFLCFFKFCTFAENTIKIGVSAKKEKTQKKNPSVKNWSKLVQVCCATKLDQFLTLELGHVFCLFSYFFENPLLSAGRTRFSKTKEQKTWTSF